MGNVNRYNPCITIHHDSVKSEMVFNLKGEYVKYEDYEKLSSKVDILNKALKELDILFDHRE